MMKRLTIVLRRLENAGLKLKLAKCEFNKTEVEYLGHVISSKGVQPAEKELTAIRDAPQPTELKAFLGLLNYYHKFLPNLSSTLEQLYSLLQK